MSQQHKNQTAQLKIGTLRVSRIHFLYAAALVAQVIIYDAWKLITPQALLQRWLVAAALLATTTVVWLLAKSRPLTAAGYRNLVYLLVLVDIFVASFAVYTQRGMASRGVFLYVIPIITAAVLASRSTILATTILSVAAYTTTTLAYFVLNFNEGYKIELYGEVGFYSVALFIVGFLVWAAVRPKK